MALVARPVPVSTTPVTNTRPASTTRANLSDDSFSTSVSISHHDLPEPLFFQDRRDGANHRRDQDTPNKNSYLPVPSTTIIDSTIESFAKMMELRDIPVPKTQGAQDLEANHKPLNIINKAVALYESSVNMLTNAHDVRGETLSFSI